MPTTTCTCACTKGRAETSRRVGTSSVRRGASAPPLSCVRRHGTRITSIASAITCVHTWMRQSPTRSRSARHHPLSSPGLPRQSPPTILLAPRMTSPARRTHPRPSSPGLPRQSPPTILLAPRMTSPARRTHPRPTQTTVDTFCRLREVGWINGTAAVNQRSFRTRRSFATPLCLVTRICDRVRRGEWCRGTGPNEDPQYDRGALRRAAARVQRRQRHGPASKPVS
jgi:hypothetical protein